MSIRPIVQQEEVPVPCDPYNETYCNDYFSDDGACCGYWWMKGVPESPSEKESEWLEYNRLHQMPYEDDSHLNFCWKTAYKKVILDAVAGNNNEDLYGQYPDSTMTIHAGCGVRPGLEQ